MGWLPFGIAASFILMLGAGAKSGWKTAAEQPPPPPPPPTPPKPPATQQAGVLRDWLEGDYRL